MKRIIDPKPELLFITYCPKCDCRFEYEEEDTWRYFNNDKVYVDCPQCDYSCNHLSSNIKR